MFAKKGVIIIEKDIFDEDTVMEACLEAGASDFQVDGDVYAIETEPGDFSMVLNEMTDKGYTFVSAQIEMMPSTYTEITDSQTAIKMQKLLDSLEDHDDVQSVWHNWENPLDV